MVQVKGHKITGFETGGDDWRFGAILSHAVFDTIEKTVETLKAKPAKKIKLEQRQDPATAAKSEASQDPAVKTKSEANPVPAVKTEPRERSGKKVNKARDRPIKAEDGLVDLVSEEEDGEYVEDKEWI